MSLVINNEKIHFECANRDKKIFTTTLFATCEIEKENQKLDCEIILSVLSNSSNYKTHTRVKTIKVIKKTSGEEVKEKKLTAKLINTELIPQFAKLSFLIDVQYLELTKSLISEEQWKQFLDSGFYVDLNKKFNIINNEENLTADQINKIFSIAKNVDSFYQTTLVKKLENFSLAWKNAIKLKSNESIFHKILFENKELFPFIFGINNIMNIKSESYWESFSDLNFETEHKLKQEMKVNSVDIWNKDFIIELKKPSTQMFNISETTKRKNIVGISSQFSSALNQVRLYMWKNDREKKVGMEHETFVMTKGVLIIGSKDSFSGELSEEKSMAYQLISENEKVKIYTFDEISDIIDSFVKEIKK